jgi:hypothetical protein
MILGTPDISGFQVSLFAPRQHFYIKGPTTMKTTSSGTDSRTRALGNAFIAIGGAAALLLLAGLAWAWISAKPGPGSACTAEMGREAKMECLQQHGR